MRIAYKFLLVANLFSQSVRLSVKLQLLWRYVLSAAVKARRQIYDSSDKFHTRIIIFSGASNVICPKLVSLLFDVVILVYE